jgi:hypothetical protein
MRQPCPKAGIFYEDSNMNGKGSKQRPTNKKKFDDNWDKIFGTKKTANDKSKAVNGVEISNSDKSHSQHQG